MATTIKLKSRNPEKFGVLDLFDDISRSKKLVLGNEKDKNSFLSIINNALSDKTPTIIYGLGWRPCLLMWLLLLERVFLSRKRTAGICLLMMIVYVYQITG